MSGKENCGKQFINGGNFVGGMMSLLGKEWVPGKHYQHTFDYGDHGIGFDHHTFSLSHNDLYLPEDELEVGLMRRLNTLYQKSQGSLTSWKYVTS